MVQSPLTIGTTLTLGIRRRAQSGKASEQSPPTPVRVRRRATSRRGFWRQVPPCCLVCFFLNETRLGVGRTSLPRVSFDSPCRLSLERIDNRRVNAGCSAIGGLASRSASVKWRDCSDCSGARLLATDRCGRLECSPKFDTPSPLGGAISPDRRRTHRHHRRSTWFALGSLVC
jgi:hypothetical protein